MLPCTLILYNIVPHTLVLSTMGAYTIISLVLQIHQRWVVTCSKLLPAGHLHWFESGHGNSHLRANHIQNCVIKSDNL
jgi:hypothetical protein